MLKMPKKFGTGIEYTGYTTPAAESPPPFHLLRFAFRPTKDTLRTQPAPLCVRRAVCGKRITAEKNRKMGGRKKEEKEMNKFKATLSRLIMAAVWGVAITTLTSTSRYLTYQPKGEEELMRRYL